MDKYVVNSDIEGKPLFKYENSLALKSIEKIAKSLKKNEKTLNK
jgi:hypothetical protein